jgi:DegV family protein with EDD domain
MNKIKIFTDSTNDLSKEILERYNIDVIPLYVSFEEKSFKDGVEIDTDTLYTLVEEYNKLPKTSAPSPLNYYNAFKPYIDNGFDLIYVAISSKLSSAIQSATLASKEFPEGKIVIVDSYNLSSGIGLQVMKAAEFAEMGLSIHEIKEKLKDISPKVKTAFVIETLDYLYKGGRCSALENFFGGVLQIKPIIKVVNGAMILGQKSRGKKRKALNIILEDTIKDRDNIDENRILVTHSFGLEDALYLKEELLKSIPGADVIITDAGCVISSHCGKNTVGILYIKK